MTESPTPVSGDAMELVERLRARTFERPEPHANGLGYVMRNHPDPLCQKAADEIERLHIENIQLKFACGYPMPSELEAHILPSNPFNCGTCEAKSAELERLRSQGGAPKGTLPKPVRERLDWTEYKFGECEECDERRNLGRDQNGALICGSCSDERYTAELEGYANALRATLSTDTKDGGGSHG